MNAQKEALPAIYKTSFASACGLLMGGSALLIGTLAIISANPIIAIVQQAVFILLFPGIVCGMAVSSNVHAWHLWVAAVANFLIYFAVGWLMFGVIAKLVRNRKH